MTALELCFKLGMFPSLVVISQMMVLKIVVNRKLFTCLRRPVYSCKWHFCASLADQRQSWDPHMLGVAGGPPPPPRSEAKCRSHSSGQHSCIPCKDKHYEGKFGLSIIFLQPYNLYQKRWKKVQQYCGLDWNSRYLQLWATPVHGSSSLGLLDGVYDAIHVALEVHGPLVEGARGQDNFSPHCCVLKGGSS